MPVFANRLLNFKKIKVVGFDMDYTLVRYNIDEFEGLTHSLAAARLADEYGYPASVKKLKFDRERAIVGLVIDRRNGNLLKLSRFGKVKTAYHGLDEINFRERQEIYRDLVIDLRDPDYNSLDTAFAISNGVLFAQLVQQKKNGAALPDYSRLADDVSRTIDSLHKDGTLKDILRADFGRYVKKDPKIASLLERLRTYGKKLMIITNSDYNYSRDLLDFSLNPYLSKGKKWQDMFDLIITFAEKPRFFEGRRRFLKVDPETGSMTNHEGPVSGGIWQSGWFGGIQNGMDIPGDEILYLGDHIYGDVVSIKKLCDWRTGLVMDALDEELNAIRASKDLQAEIDIMMARKERLEHRADEAEMLRRAGQSVRVSDQDIAEQNHLNSRISELLDELKTCFNPWWGGIFRAGSEESRYAEQVEKYACIYMTRVSDLHDYSPRTYFRPPRRVLPHECD